MVIGLLGLIVVGFALGVWVGVAFANAQRNLSVSDKQERLEREVARHNKDRAAAKEFPNCEHDAWTIDDDQYILCRTCGAIITGPDEQTA